MASWASAGGNPPAVRGNISRMLEHDNRASHDPLPRWHGDIHLHGDTRLRASTCDESSCSAPGARGGVKIYFARKVLFAREAGESSKRPAKVRKQILDALKLVRFLLSVIGCTHFRSS